MPAAPRGMSGPPALGFRPRLCGVGVLVPWRNAGPSCHPLPQPNLSTDASVLSRRSTSSEVLRPRLCGVGVVTAARNAGLFVLSVVVSPQSHLSVDTSAISRDVPGAAAAARHRPRLCGVEVLTSGEAPDTLVHCGSMASALCCSCFERRNRKTVSSVCRLAPRNTAP